MPAINSPEYWDGRFRSGDWARRAGREQTARFARLFLRHVTLPAAPFTFLDYGCALGDAVAVVQGAYPHGAFSGCDVSPSAIAQCTARYGALARFFTGESATLDGTWDIILCCNVLEHFADPFPIVEALLAHCRTLYLLVPFREEYHGQPITANAEIEHQCSFHETTFQPLLDAGLASAITAQVVPCAEAYVPTPLHALVRGLYYWVKGRSLREAFYLPPHLIYTITR
jgi:SAM-dependent methyltransferase